MKKTIFLFFAAILCAMTANAQWALMGTLTDWGSGKAMTLSGTTATCTVDLAGKTEYKLKVKNGGTWYGRNSTTISNTTTTAAFNTSGGDVILKTTIPGTYTFSFDTGTKKLTVTYPEVSAPHDITVRAKLPATWTSSTISAWVWTSENASGTAVTAEKDGDYYKITKNAGALYVIFRNGADWNGDKNQTVDLCYTEDVCLQLNQSGTANATATVIDCGAVAKDITVKAVVPEAWGDNVWAHVWETGASGTDVKLTEKEGNWYVYTKNCLELNIIFKSGEGWSNIEQTGDIKGIKENACYSISSINKTDGKCNVTVVDCEAAIEPEVKPEDVYTVVGSSAELGLAWDPAKEANDMEKQGDGSYKKVYSNVELTSDVEWKIAKNDSWWNDTPLENKADNGNSVLVIAKSGIYNVTFTLSADLKTAHAEAELLEETNTVADCFISGNAALTGGAGWEGNEFKMEYDPATETYSYTLTGLAAETAYELQVVLGGNWYGYEKLQTIPTGVENKEGHIAFTLTEAGNVTVTYHATNGINLTGNFAIPVTYDYYIAGTENLTGFNWSANGLGMEKDGELYKATFTELNAGEYEFKITDGQWNTEEDKTHEWGYSSLGAVYEEVSEGTDGEGNPNGNIKFVTEEAKNITVIFDATAGKITLGGLTEKVIEYGVTFNVTVPEGTPACYICGAWDWNTFKPMTKVDDTHYTLEIAEATKDHGYKYTCGEGWEFVEKDAEGNDLTGDRTWSENDVVAAWAAPAETHTYTVAGSATLFGEDWDNTINEMTLQDDGTYVWTATGVTLSESVEFKVIEDQNWDIAWPASNYVIEIGEDKANTPGTYDVNIYFNAAEAKADNTTGIYVVLTPATIEITEEYDITITNLETEEVQPGILALMGSESEMLGLELQLFLNDYTKENKEYQLNEASYLTCFAGELTFVSGSMTQADDATSGKTYTGKVIAELQGMYFQFNLTMYKKQLPTETLAITGAELVVDLWNNIIVTAVHNASPVIVKFSDFEYVASKEYTYLMLEIGEWVDEDGDWECDNVDYISELIEEATVTISGSTFTLKSKFEGTDANYDLTITGTLPLIVGEGDNSSVLALDGQTKNVYVTRSFESGNLYTVSFPFAMNETTTKDVFGSRVEVYEYTSLTEETDGLVLNFTKLSTPEITAGKPYLVKPNKESYGFGLTNVAISSTTVPVGYTTAGTTITMESVLTVAANAKTNGKTQYWLAEDNNLYNKSVNLKGLRAIFNVQTNKSNVRARAAFNENVETGVEDIIATDAPVKVIVNGQLIIIRDGEMYNVQGQLVK